MSVIFWGLYAFTPAPQKNRSKFQPPDPSAETVKPTEREVVVYEYDEEYIEKKYEVLNLRVIHRRRRTGFEESKEFPVRINDLIAGRYQVGSLCLHA